MEISEPAEYALLGLLWDGPQHGYELHRAFSGDQELGAICRLEQSQLYAFLKKLEHLGYLESTLEPQEGRPPRRVVGLTTKGRTVFRQWIEAPVPRPREVRLLFLLKLYFARAFGTQTIRALITRQIEACQVFVQKLQEGAPELAGKGSAPSGEALKDFRVIVHQARIRQIEATIGWLEELQGQAEGIALSASREKSSSQPGR
ncbi:MAG TPA: helix-turn-helix transcriptional regulator [Ktedonobacterales bacterium]|nr:helix-turn-helix transcriptional regulator [Ktedonobacterales bacterium]